MKCGCSHVQSVASGRMCPLGRVHFVAEVSRYQLQVCVAHLKHSQGAMLIVNVLEDKLDAVCSSLAYILGYIFFILQSLSISLHDMQNGLRCWRIMF